MAGSQSGVDWETYAESKRLSDKGGWAVLVLIGKEL